MKTIKKTFNIIKNQLFWYVIFISLTDLSLYLYGISREQRRDIMSVITEIFVVAIVTNYILTIIKIQKLSKINDYRKDVILPIATSEVEKEYQNILNKTVNSEQARIDKINSQRQEFQDSLSMWTHNIKIPITGLQLILDDNPTYKDILVAKNKVLQIQQNLTAILGYISLSEGNNDLLIDRVDLNELIDEILKRNAWDFVNKNQHLIYNHDLPTIVTDKKWLEILMEQIIINANKYTPKDGTIKIYSESKERFIVIEDSGIGIDSGDIKRIFENGFTGKNGRQNMNSSGLGLYLANQIAEMLSLEIKVDSKKDSGSKFVIEYK
ncbi:sensor histidine kinase [Lactobacillus terrae]|uniref:sensor histidine kinase n=1 Tax=Lactobacillus terrae TaxID=2269374 RepID=UPI000C1B7575|nr:sensor histidine kinase [Lactobacillus terrae]